MKKEIWKLLVTLKDDALIKTFDKNFKLKATELGRVEHYFSSSYTNENALRCSWSAMSLLVNASEVTTKGWPVLEDFVALANEFAYRSEKSFAPSLQNVKFNQTYFCRCSECDYEGSTLH